MIRSEHLNVCISPTSKIVVFRDVRLYRADAAKKKMGGLVIRPPLAILQMRAFELESKRLDCDVGECYYRKQTRATNGDRRIVRSGCPRIGELDGRHAIRKGRHRRPFVLRPSWRPSIMAEFPGFISAPEQAEKCQTATRAEGR